MFKKYKIYLFLIIIIVLGYVFYINRTFIKDYFLNSKKIDLPQEVTKEEIIPEEPEEVDNDPIETDPEVSTSTNVAEIKSQINLKVPFTIQSPDQKWEGIYKEACEEASVLMVYGFLKNKDITVDFAMNQIADMISWENINLTLSEDLTSNETLALAKGFYKLNGEVVKLNSIDDIKKIVSSGIPVILPALGRELKNPNFKSPGPLYHMLVVKGYTKDGLIITNDPGTRKGKDYLYDPNILWSAIADWDISKKFPDVNKKVGIILK